MTYSDFLFKEAMKSPFNDIDAAYNLYDIASKKFADSNNSSKMIPKVLFEAGRIDAKYQLQDNETIYNLKSHCRIVERFIYLVCTSRANLDLLDDLNVAFIDLKRNADELADELLDPQHKKVLKK